MNIYGLGWIVELVMLLFYSLGILFMIFGQLRIPDLCIKQWNTLFEKKYKRLWIKEGSNLHKVLTNFQNYSEICFKLTALVFIVTLVAVNLGLLVDMLFIFVFMSLSLLYLLAAKFEKLENQNENIGGFKIAVLFLTSIILLGVFMLTVAIDPQMAVVERIEFAGESREIVFSEVNEVVGELGVIAFLNDDGYTYVILHDEGYSHWAAFVPVVHRSIKLDDDRYQRYVSFFSLTEKYVMVKVEPFR